MKSQSDGAVDVATGTAPESGAVEQKPVAEGTSFEDQLIQLARESGNIDPAKPSDSAQPEVTQPESETTPEEEPEVETPEPPETPPEGKDPEGETEEEEEAEPSKDALEKLVPLREVIEERGKKKRATARAERLEGELETVRAQLKDAQLQLSQSLGPMPTVDNPLIDIQDGGVLDRLERVYEAIEEVDTENINEDGTVSVPASIGKDGRLVYQNIAPEQARLAQKRADRVLRKDIPRRRQYLAERAQADAGAAEWYPDLKNSDHQFTQLVNQLTNNILSGQALHDPQLRFWVANAVYGYITRGKESQASNGNGDPATVKKVVASAKTKIAPTASRTRSLPERKSGAALTKANEEFAKNPSPENAEALVEATLRQRSGQEVVQPVAE